MCHSPAEAYYVNKILKSKYPSTRGWNDFPKTPKPIKHRAKGQYLVQQAHRLFQRQRKLNRELTEQRQMVRNPMGSISPVDPERSHNQNQSQNFSLSPPYNLLSLHQNCPCATYQFIVCLISKITLHCLLGKNGSGSFQLFFLCQVA